MAGTLPGRMRPATWAYAQTVRRRDPMAVAVLRLVLIVNVLILIAIGFVYLLLGERPAGVYIAVALWLSSGFLLALLPRLDE